jgi:SAM-dependent methyltransferase
MTSEAKRAVRDGYDRVADLYFQRFGISTVRQKWLDRLLSSLPSSGGRALDLGCGAGVPVARDLTAAGHIVVGVDGSSQQIVRARQNVPEATFVEADMCSVDFDVGSFDAAGAFYSITHIPPAQQGSLIAKISTWLKPSGTLIASFGVGVVGEWTSEWLGTKMFFGHAGEAETLKSLADARLRVRRSAVDKQDNEEAAFLWIEATKDL